MSNYDSHDRLESIGEQIIEDNEEFASAVGSSEDTALMLVKWYKKEITTRELEEFMEKLVNDEAYRLMGI